MSNFESMFQMDRPCPDNLCNYTYHAKKKPFKCPICDAHIGEKQIFFVSNVCVLKAICVLHPNFHDPSYFTLSF